MDKLLQTFTSIPSMIMIDYIADQNAVSSIKIINNHISVIQKKLFDLSTEKYIEEKYDIERENNRENIFSEEELRSNINNFIGMRDLVMDQLTM